MDFTKLSDRVAVAGQVRPDDVGRIARAGFVAIINNRPDGEAPDQPTSLSLETEARRHGLAYWHVPITPGEMSEKDVRAFAAALGEADGPVLAFCRTGARSTNLWKAAQALS